MIVGAVLLALLFSAPNLFSVNGESFLAKMPSWLPHKTVNLGLDLQRGSHILLQVDLASVIKQRSDDLVSSLRPALREEKLI